jgi:8-oxo-dGTP diphosphatase
VQTTGSAPPRAEIDVVAAVIWRDGRFLAARRPEGKPQARFWEFPGGKVEPGESLERALARELDEELGIAPTEMAFWREARHAYPHLRVRLHFFHVYGFTGRVVPREGHELRWLAPGAADVPFLEADAGIVAQLAQTPAR